MSDERLRAVHVIGGGLAGSEAAWQIAARGIPDNVYNREVIPRWKERFVGASAAGA